MKLNDLLARPGTDPSALYRMRDGMLAVDLLAAAIAHLDLFSWIATRGRAVALAEICEQFEIQERPADVLLTLAAALGVVLRHGDSFEATGLANDFLMEGSPWNMRPYYGAMKSRPQTMDMLKVLKTGKPANWGSYEHQEWIKAMERPDFAKQFTAAMDCRGVLLAGQLAPRLKLAGRKRLLDIAGGSGVYACAIAAAHPQIRAAVLERPPVDDIARQAIASRGARERVEVITADMFAGELPSGFDVHLLSNVLHDWEVPIVRQLLERSAKAMKKGDLMIVHDAYLNEEKTGPLEVAEYSALLMNICEGRCYSLLEMRGYLKDAGFDWESVVESGIWRSAIVARRE